MNTEAHTFTSLSYRDSLFPPCPWCSWLLSDCRSCGTWEGEGRALEIKLFHNLLHSTVSCSLKCGSIMLCLILPANLVAFVYSKLCLVFTNDIWLDVSWLKIMRPCLPFWCYWKVNVRVCLWALCFNKIFTNCSSRAAVAFERFMPVKTANLSKPFWWLATQLSNTFVFCLKVLQESDDVRKMDSQILLPAHLEPLGYLQGRIYLHKVQSHLKKE